MDVLRKKAKLENLRDLVGFVRVGAEKSDFSIDKADEICMAVEELIMNIISYAYPEKTGDIEVAYELRDEHDLSILISDQGIPFDITAASPDLDKTLEERANGGLGIHMAKNLMDELKYKRIGDTNQTILMKKNR